MNSSASEPAPIESHAELLTFFIGGAEYAVGLRRVREVIPCHTITRVPQMPPALRGVTNLRGQVVPVVDLSVKFHGVETAIGHRTCIVLVEAILDGVPTAIGLMTEAIGHVLSLAAADRLPPPSFGAPIRTEFLDGIARVGNRLALLLCIDRLLTTAELLSPLLAQDDPGGKADQGGSA